MENETEIVTFDLPEFWASALVNHDMSGYDISDIRDIQKFFDDNNLNGCMVETDGEPFFMRSNDALDIACNCLEYSFLIHK